jgi:hypothetical protein
MMAYGDNEEFQALDPSLNYLQPSSGIDWGGLLKSVGPTAVAGILQGTGLLSGNQPKTGYQGTVPKYQAIRQQVPMANQDPARRPGSGGRQYFTNTQYLPRSDESGIAAALGKAQEQSNMIAQANLAPTQGERTALLNAAQSVYPMYTPYGAPATTPPAETPPADTTAPVQEDSGGSAQPDGSNSGGAARGGMIGYAQGGLLGLAQGGATGYYLGGATDGMADKIPATIANKQPAKLSHGEFVIPADIVSALGSGNSSAGAKVLYGMMDRVRQHAYGTKKQIKPANLKKTLPV